VLAATFVVLATAGRPTAAMYDWTEYRRASLPPAAVAGLRALDAPIRIEVLLDREDSRRRQLERDALAKIRLARSDVKIVMPLDEQQQDRERERAHDDSYGRLVIRVGDRTGETRSTSRREIVTRIFEIAGREAPDWSQAPYPGYPLPLDATKLRLARILLYLVMPLAILAIGLAIERRRRSRGSRRFWLDSKDG
jgi:hypothetical protein